MVNLTGPAWRAFCAADELWSAELTRLYGRNSGDIRYTQEGTGKPGSLLRHLYEQRCYARVAADKEH